MESTDNNLSKNIIESDNSINRRCQDYGRALLLLDLAMSNLNTRRGKVTNEIIDDLEKTL